MKRTKIDHAQEAELLEKELMPGAKYFTEGLNDRCCVCRFLYQSILLQCEEFNWSGLFAGRLIIFLTHLCAQSALNISVLIMKALMLFATIFIAIRSATRFLE